MEITYIRPTAQVSNGYAGSGPALKRYLENEGLFLREDGKPRETALCYGYPRMLRLAPEGTKKRIIFTMFESDEIPASWDEDLALADVIVVPSTFCAETFAKRGWPTVVVPLGIEDDIWPLLDRTKLQTGSISARENGVFTFLSYESLNVRKGFWELIKAWEIAFGDRKDVRLVLKTAREDNVIPLHQYPNIEVHKGAWPRDLLLTLLHDADAFVFPSRGEGFGHTPLEALATGLPVIAPNRHGIAEYFNPTFFMACSTKRIPAKYDHIKEPTGFYRYCTPEKLAKAMLKMKANVEASGPEGMAAFGETAHKWVMENWTYRNTAKKLADVIRKI